MLRRGRAGLGGVIKRKEDLKALKRRGADLEAAELSHAAELLDTFKESLTRFAEEHKTEISSDPQFRRHFHTMCTRIGVDPLNSQKGFWAEYLGFGDFYYELAVQITEICISTRPLNGGVISLSDLLEHLRSKRRKRTGQGANEKDIGGDDVLTAVSKLKSLGGGIRVQKVGGKHLVLSVPQELSGDEVAAMVLAENGDGSFTRRLLREQGWEEERIDRCTQTLLQQEMVWLDAGANGQEEIFWFVSLWSDAHRTEDDSDDESKA